MTRFSILQTLYVNQRKSIEEQKVKENKCWRGKYRFFLIWMLIGILTTGIPLIIFVILYIRPEKMVTSTQGKCNILL